MPLRLCAKFSAPVGPPHRLRLPVDPMSTLSRPAPRDYVATPPAGFVLSPPPLRNLTHQHPRATCPKGYSPPPPAPPSPLVPPRSAPARIQGDADKMTMGRNLVRIFLSFVFHFSINSSFPLRPSLSPPLPALLPLYSARRRTASSSAEDIEFLKNFNIVVVMSFPFPAARCCASRARSTACHSTRPRLLVYACTPRVPGRGSYSHPICTIPPPPRPSLSSMYPILPSARFLL
ncbi:hypothetical protein B0H16DRAFT_1889469 [Mycena metata]|uniref:Uncharacterized protein n=1 Tax=Mycena metata TaxID=1033252 RepID=A0AAD7IKS5_9AGAR|nr:hypothetical protein B0H16DRAFT_1889469 [Mycena metata]